MLPTVVRRSATFLASNKLHICSASALSKSCRAGTPKLYSTRTSTVCRSNRVARAAVQSRTFYSTTKMSANTRTESDAFGEIQVPSEKYWGAQTERSLENFKINQPQDRMPPPIVRAFGILKGAAATVNMHFGLGIGPCLYLQCSPLIVSPRSQDW